MESGAALLLISAFFHASWNALTKRSTDKEAFLMLVTSIGAIITLVLIFLTKASFKELQGETLIFTLGSGVFEGLYMAMLSRALSGATLGKAYAIMRGGAMLFVWIISMTFLGETSTLVHLLGASAVFLGISALSYEGKNGSSQKLDIWPFLAAACITGYHICYHQALKTHANPQVLFFVSMILSALILGIFLGKNIRTRFKNVVKTQFRNAVLTAFLSTASFLIFLYALQIVEPGYAISLRNSSIFFALLFSFLLKESLTRKQWIGASVIGIGTILLSLT